MKIEHAELRSIKELNLPEIMQGYGLTLSKTNQTKCPFHDDKTPSLHVGQKSGKWVWHCFGCRKSGNVIDFVMAYENIPFAAAYEKLLSSTRLYREMENPPPPSSPSRGEEEEMDWELGFGD